GVPRVTPAGDARPCGSLWGRHRADAVYLLSVGWESMPPRDHPAEETKDWLLAPALRSATTVRHPEMLHVVAHNSQQQEQAQCTYQQPSHASRLEPPSISPTRPIHSLGRRCDAHAWARRNGQSVARGHPRSFNWTRGRHHRPQPPLRW